ncbi:hypothetical protein HNQ93_001210 [Hymenobacter luteus]|uniref:Uncharacterized protein n=2 Tax=Hymenobacter TaxID=89966 RepID=A0A7W9T020_9BACT|nr:MULTISPECIES: hypothetical protein [Hymenobacter]MBB4601429.1 hypothetical protein [Hymenobacter latericoloratus]MBB6058364.1 hypothetical protein [Hymenobacter luteus]
MKERPALFFLVRLVTGFQDKDLAKEVLSGAQAAKTFCLQLNKMVAEIGPPLGLGPLAALLRLPELSVENYFQ